MSFDFAKLRFTKAAVPVVVVTPEPTAESLPEVIGNRLDDDAVIEFWEERAAIQKTDNIDLIRWHQSMGSPPELLRRHCELLAAADMSMQLGTYVEVVIRPLLTIVN